MRKQHILEEIRRCAASNGGVPLGRERFARETGIKESDWSGKYWARWNDALGEAGFQPNKLNSALSDDHLLNQYALFVRELGRLPVHAELLLKRRSDPDFPSGNTFGRFGSKAQLASVVAEYCRKTPGLGDIAPLCEIVAPSDGEAAVTEDLGVSDEFGFVYLIKSGGFFKIGRSNAAGRREREIALQLPEKANTVHVIKTDDPVGIEAYWHRRFSEYRKNGEWFELSTSQIKAFKRRKFM
jgi:hypothetical protein